MVSEGGWANCSSSGVVVRSTGAYEKLIGHPARPVLGWVTQVECPVPSHYTCQAVQSGYRESVSWLSTVLRKRRKIEVPPTWCSMPGVVKDTTQGVKVQPVCGLSSLVRSVIDHKNSATATLTHARKITTMWKKSCRKGSLPPAKKGQSTSPAKKGSLPLLPKNGSLPQEEEAEEERRRKKTQKKKNVEETEDEQNRYIKIIYSVDPHELLPGVSHLANPGIETVSAGGRSARPARLGVHPIWWRWHGNTKSLSKVQSSDV